MFGLGPKIGFRIFFHIKVIVQEVEQMADITMPMNGKVISINTEVGKSVSVDDELVIIEAMKMELPVVATEAGEVKEVKAKEGESYQVGDVLVVLG